MLGRRTGRQQLLHGFFHLQVSADTAVAVSNNALLVDDELRWPYITEIVAEDFLFVVDDDWEWDPHLLDCSAELGYIMLDVDARCVDADNDETILRVLVVEIDDVRHRLDAWLAVECPEINDDDLAFERFKAERFAVDPDVGFAEFFRFVRAEVLGYLTAVQKRREKQGCCKDS